MVTEADFCFVVFSCFKERNLKEVCPDHIVASRCVENVVIKDWISLVTVCIARIAISGSAWNQPGLDSSEELID